MARDHSTGQAGGDDPRAEARRLFWQGYTVAEIGRRLDTPYGTVDSWKRRDGWADAPVATRIEDAADRRLAVLVVKPDKSDRDLAEIDQLGRLVERMARVRRYQDSGRESDLNPSVHNRAEGRRRKAEQNNTLDDDQITALQADFRKHLYKYQRAWLAAKSHTVRNILKSRQIGATWYFAREAFIDAVTTGDNQIFLSASKAQAHVFRQYIVQWVRKITGVELKGTPITVSNGATLYFLGTNAKTAQSYHGHVYLDEYAWIGRLAEFKKVATGMATHKKWRITYFSTPSTIGHDANAFWAGKEFNDGRDRAQFDLSHAVLRHGAVGPDGMWRHMVTIEDAAAGGCDLFAIDQLRQRYNERDFANLFLCHWVDDSASFFTHLELSRCAVDAWDAWPDVPEGPNRHNLGPVWIGYDPSRSRDDASIAVVVPPRTVGGVYRVVERVSFSGADFSAQSEALRGLTGRYEVDYMGIDCSGIGQGVYEMVKAWWPAVTPITYSVETKSRMVLKAKHLISRRRVEWDAGQTDVTMAFMAIRQVMTPSGRQMTFQAGRTDTTGHADVAWAVMHALDRVEFHSFDDGGGRRQAFMEIV